MTWVGSRAAWHARRVQSTGLSHAERGGNRYEYSVNRAEQDLQIVRGFIFCLPLNEMTGMLCKLLASVSPLGKIACANTEQMHSSKGTPGAPLGAPNAVAWALSLAPPPLLLSLSVA